MQMAV